MKTSIAVLLLMIGFCSCRSFSYFHSPNNLRNMEGRLHLENGKVYEGKISVYTENMFGRPVKLYGEDDKRPMQFSLDDVTGFSIGDHWYERKQIKESFSLGRRAYFMKRLTQVSSRIHVYEHLRSEIVNKTSTRYISELYVQLPGVNDGVYAANGTHFVPHFEKKFTQYVSDCPALAKKIADKHHGYFYAQLNVLKDKREEVLLRIIDEYNQCKGM